MSSTNPSTFSSPGAKELLALRRRIAPRAPRDPSSDPDRSPSFDNAPVALPASVASKSYSAVVTAATPAIALNFGQAVLGATKPEKEKGKEHLLDTSVKQATGGGLTQVSQMLKQCWLILTYLLSLSMVKRISKTR